MKGDREKNDLNGRVKSVRVEAAEFTEEDGRRVEKPWYGYAINFDLAGNLVERLHRNPDGSAWRTTNDYSETGDLIATSNYDASGRLTNQVRYMYSYDDKGRPIAEQRFMSNGETYAPTVYRYDAEGRRTKIQTSSFTAEDNSMIGIEGTNTSIAAHNAKRIETSYDEREATIEVRIYNPDDALIARIEIARDARGNPLEETQYLGDVVSFDRCSNGACPTQEQLPLTVEQRAELEAEVSQVFAPGAVMAQHKHSYDERGRLVESNLTMMEMQVSRQTFAYDEAGNKVEQASYDEDGSFQSKALFTRKFDEHGNWTEEIVSTASKWDAEFGLSIPLNVTRRAITYY